MLGAAEGTAVSDSGDDGSCVKSEPADETGPTNSRLLYGQANHLVRLKRECVRARQLQSSLPARGCSYPTARGFSIDDLGHYTKNRPKVLLAIAKRRSVQERISSDCI